jgi:hypothetical protein
MARHPEAQELALFVSRDLPAWRNFAVSRHVSGCANCRRETALLSNASSAFASEVDLIPGGAEAWDQLAAEMRANIRLGLEAGECVGEARFAADGEAAEDRPAGWYAGWNPARWWNSSRLGGWLHMDANWMRVVSAGAAVALISTGIWWWQQDEDASLRSYFTSQPAAVASQESTTGEGEVVFRTVADGLQVERGGKTLTLAHTGRAATGLTVSLNGSMTAKFVDEDTSQVTIHHVYAE